MNLRALLVFAMLSVTVSVFSQSTLSEKKSDVNTDVEITRVYEQVVKDGHGTPQIYQELANTYYFRNNFPEAKIWFEKLFEIEKQTDNTVIFRYKQTLKALRLINKRNDHISYNVGEDYR